MFRIQLSGQSAAAIATAGKSNSIPCTSSALRAGTASMSIPSSDGAVHSDDFPDTPTQSIRFNRSFPGYNRSPRPTICAYNASDCVGRAMITVSTRGISVPSVNTIQLIRHDI